MTEFVKSEENSKVKSELMKCPSGVAVDDNDIFCYY